MTKALKSIWVALAVLIGLGSAVVGCAFVGMSANSEPNTEIVGIVTDQATGQPVVGARVADNIYAGSPKKPCQEAWTDNTGHYVLHTWYEEHSIVVSAPGYPPKLVGFGTKIFTSEPKVEMNVAIAKQ